MVVFGIVGRGCRVKARPWCLRTPRLDIVVQGHRGHISRSFGGRCARRPGFMRSARGGGCCALFILSYPLSGPSSSDGVYVFSSKPLGHVEEEGGP